MVRRNFLSYITVGAAALIAGGTLPGCTYLHSDTPSALPLPAGGLKLDLTSPGYTGLKNIGGVVTVNNNIIVAHLSSGDYVALSNICTHQQCTVGFDGMSLFVCPCHGSVYDQKGTVVTGPAPFPLKKYTTSLSGDILTITE